MLFFFFFSPSLSLALSLVVFIHRVYHISRKTRIYFSNYIAATTRTHWQCVNMTKKNENWFEHMLWHPMHVPNSTQPNLASNWSYHPVFCRWYFCTFPPFSNDFFLFIADSRSQNIFLVWVQLQWTFALRLKWLWIIIMFLLCRNWIAVILGIHGSENRLK